jgi:hypothetical protein
MGSRLARLCSGGTDVKTAGVFAETFFVYAADLEQRQLELPCEVRL